MILFWWSKTWSVIQKKKKYYAHFKLNQFFFLSSNQAAVNVFFFFLVLQCEAYSIFLFCDASMCLIVCLLLGKLSERASERENRNKWVQTEFMSHNQQICLHWMFTRAVNKTKLIIIDVDIWWSTQQYLLTNVLRTFIFWFYTHTHTLRERNSSIQTII